jgi:hypothetical protein
MHYAANGTGPPHPPSSGDREADAADRTAERLEDNAEALLEASRTLDTVSRRLAELARRWNAIEGFPIADQIEGPSK